MRRLTPRDRRCGALTAAAVLGIAGAVVVGIGLPHGETGRRAVGSGFLEVAARPAAAPTAGPPSATPTPGPVARFTPTSPIHLVIPAVDLDLPLLPHEPHDGMIDPPTLTAGYWIEPYGAPAGTAEQAENTLYIAAHSAGRGDDGFDPLLTADHEGAALTPGDLVEVRTPQGTVTYAVERTQRYGKGELPAASEIWEVSPGRLVLITCFQRADGRAATENLVVVAETLR